MTNTTQKIRAALEHDGDINLHAHPVEIEESGAIYLHGELGDIRAKRKAWMLARAAVGRDDVVDDLRVETGERRGDQELQEAAVEMLKREPTFAEVTVIEGADAPGRPPARGWIGVQVDDARITLTGVLGGLHQRRLAEVLCWWLPGSADVANRIHVEPPEPDTDTGLASAIGVVLERDPSVDSAQLGVTARDAIVRLEGVVATAEQARLAELDCWYVAGVHDVDNALLVQSAP